MHIYEYIQHPGTTLHLTGRAPKPVKVNDAVCGDANVMGAAGVVGTPGGPAVAPGTAGA